MEKINLLHNEELYHSGLIAKQFSECLYASDYVNEMVLENIQTISDQHTFYYCILLRKVKRKDYIINVIFDTDENHVMLLNALSNIELGVRCIDENGKTINFERLPSKIKKKQHKNLLHDFNALRHQEPVKPRKKQSRIEWIRNRFKRESDDFYEE